MEPGFSPPFGGHKHPPDKYPVDRRPALRACCIVDLSRMTQGYPETERRTRMTKIAVAANGIVNALFHSCSLRVMC